MTVQYADDDSRTLDVTGELVHGGSLMGGACTTCGAVHFPRRHVCPECQGQDVAEVALSGRGELFTVTTVHAPPPGYLGAVPYHLGIVTLPDGIRVTSRIEAEASPMIGDAVEFSPPPADRPYDFAYRVVAR